MGDGGANASGGTATVGSGGGGSSGGGGRGFRNTQDLELSSEKKKNKTMKEFMGEVKVEDGRSKWRKEKKIIKKKK